MKKNLVIIILALYAIGISGFFAYQEFFEKDNDNTEIPNTNTTDNSTVDTPIESNVSNEEVTLTDRYAFYISEYEKQAVVYMVDNGKLYSKAVDLSNLLSEHNYDDYLYVTYENDASGTKLEKKDLTLIDKITNVKRIKVYNISSNGSGSFDLIIITNDGKVYSVLQGVGTDFSPKVVNDFKDYEVEDIISYQPVTGCIVGSDACNPHYTITLKDGSTVTK